MIVNLLYRKFMSILKLCMVVNAQSSAGGQILGFFLFFSPFYCFSITAQCLSLAYFLAGFIIRSQELNKMLPAACSLIEVFDTLHNYFVQQTQSQIQCVSQLLGTERLVLQVLIDTRRGYTNMNTYNWDTNRLESGCEKFIFICLFVFFEVYLRCDIFLWRMILHFFTKKWYCTLPGHNWAILHYVEFWIFISYCKLCTDME